MKKVLGVLVVLVFIMQTNLSIAATNKELENQQKNIQNEQKEIDKKEDELKNRQDEVEAQKSSTLKEVEKLINQISSSEEEIEKLQNQIDILQNNIDNAEKGIKEKEEQYAKEKALLDERLLTICESGETQYLDVLLASDNLVDFISKYYMISELVQSDTELLESIEEQRKEIETEKAKLESDKKEISLAQAEKEAKYAELKNAKSQKDAQVKKLNAEEKSIQEELDQYEKDKKQLEKDLKKIAEEIKKNNEASKNNVTNIVGKPSSSGYIFPVAGLSKNNINNKSYPSYPGHTGVDINLNVVGKNVVAVKDGTVVISKAITGSIKNYDSNGNYVGSYSSYGEYIVINHHDGTMTLYGHMKPGSRKVSVGQEVKRGQVIGTVGNTGNCQPRPTPSSPLNGTHLHFEVRIDGKAVNPLPYLP